MCGGISPNFTITNTNTNTQKTHWSPLSQNKKQKVRPLGDTVPELKPSLYVFKEEVCLVMELGPNTPGFTQKATVKCLLLTV